MKRFLLFAAFAAITSSALAQEKSFGPNAFLKKNPSAKSIHWKGDGNQIVIRLKSGKTETYNLADAKQKAAAEAKWGRLPAAPPPPPKVIMTKFAAPSTPPEPPVPAINEDKVTPAPASPALPVPPTESLGCSEPMAPPPPPPPAKKKKGKRVYS